MSDKVESPPCDESCDEDEGKSYDGTNKNDDTKKFLQKMFYNVMVSLSGDDFEYGMFINSIDSYGSSMFPRTVIDYMNKKHSELAEARKAENNTLYVSYRDALNAEDRLHITKLIEDEQPWVKDSYKIPKNIQYMADLLDFSTDETVIFYFYYLQGDMEYNQTRIVESTRYSLNEPISFGRACFEIGRDRLHKIYSMNTNLLTSGILISNESYAFKGHFLVIEKIRNLLDDPLLDDDRLIKVLFPSNLDTDLTMDDYKHLTDDTSIFNEVINNALIKKSQGINSLLWGLPGTGKTELPLLLAKEHGWDLRIIGDVNNTDDSEKSRNERLLSLKLAQKLFKNPKTNKNIVLLFDEFEDLFKIDMNANFSKAFINRTIEKTPVPIIWTTNSLQALGDAVIRRMTFSIEFGIPNIKARRRIWNKYNDKFDLDLKEDDIEHLSVTYDVVPALIANTAKVAHLSGVAASKITKVIENLDTAMRYGNKRKTANDSHQKAVFKPSLSNADISLDNMVDQIVSKGIEGFSVCAYGPPGTGKSAFGRFLAKQMDKRVIFKRTSDIQSMWVGECEKNIAKMFEESKDDSGFLILDEADTFLRSREMAKNSWEISQSNEMFTQMETHTQPFFCTTNLMDVLDAATLRRFTFKIKFDFLKREQLPETFKFFFGVDAPSDIEKIDILTPGDFANIKNKAEILGITKAKEIYDFLLEECVMKPQYTKPMGFQSASLNVAKKNMFYDNAGEGLVAKKDGD